MTSSVYQATVEELESLLSPRVVSRSLQEGLKVVGKSPETVDLEDLEKILKGQIYRQLQVALPVTEAKTRIQDILRKIKTVEAEELRQTQSGRTLSNQSDTLAQLKARLKPFNLYFEWAEVQKLRALVQLLEVEQEAGREANKLVADAREQLKIVEQKLEDELVHQAKELGELAATFESVQTLGGAKVRRLDKLIGRIKEAQDERQLAGAEIERARKLAIDLRKLMESSVVLEETDLPADSPPTMTDNDGLLDVDEEGADLLSIDTEGLAPEVNAKLQQLDAESEGHDLDVLAKDFSALLSYRPELEVSITELREKLTGQASIAQNIPRVREDLLAQQQTQQGELKAELETALAKGQAAPSEITTTELEQATRVALGVLETTLPDPQDVQHIRSLVTLLEQQLSELSERQAADAEREQARLEEQAAALAGFEETLLRYADNAAFAAEYAAFRGSVAKVKSAQEAGRYDGDALTVARETERMLAATVADRTQEETERERAQLQTFAAEFGALPRLESLQDEAEALRTVLDSGLIKVENGVVGQTVINGAAQRLQSYKLSLKEALGGELRALRETAEIYGLDGFLQSVNDASAQLEAGTYPDLESLKRALSAAKDARRSEQVSDLRLLEAELKNYQGASAETLDDIGAFIASARASLEAGEPAADFERGWSLLELLRQDTERRSAGFIPRLDDALEQFKSLAKLNSEEVAQVRRTLSHLDSQRDAIGRVSAGLRSELEASLSKAEEMISELQEQFEATRAIAGQLVNASVLDDLFGAFDAGPLDASDTPAAEPEAATPVTDVKTGFTPLDVWLAECRAVQGVRGVLVYRQMGFAGGYIDLELPPLSAALEQLTNHFDRLGTDISAGTQQLAVFETRGHGVISARPASDTRVVVITEQPAALEPTVHMLRRDLPKLREWLNAPSLA